MMEKIYFIDEQHERNYRTTVTVWSAAKNIEYQTACYILSVPMIFDKVNHIIDNIESPTDWILRYLNWQAEYNQSWERYNDDDDNLHPEHDAWIDRKPFDLTSSMVQLGKLSLNLWNSYDEFNLMRCLETLDNEHCQVLTCAIDMRIGKYI